MTGMADSGLDVCRDHAGMVPVGKGRGVSLLAPQRAGGAGTGLPSRLCRFAVAVGLGRISRTGPKPESGICKVVQFIM